MDSKDIVIIARQRKRIRQQNRKKANIWPRALGGCVALLFLGLFLLLFGGVAAAVGVYAYFAKDLPSSEEVGLRASADFLTSQIYDRTGQHLLYEILDPEGGARTKLPLNRIPAYLRTATVAMEDKTFYTNPGVSIEGILRAAWSNFQGNQIQGGSTLTQQLVKLVIISPEERYQVSYARKIKEAILSLELSRRYPGVEGKDQILEWYLNTIPYGRVAYGVEAASEQYFAKSAEELTLAESAMLAAIPQYPMLNPLDNYPEAKRRQEIVLDQMFLQGYITAEEAYAAKQEKLTIISKPFDIQSPHFVMYVRQILEERYGLDYVYLKGLRVYTTLDVDLQAEAERIAREHVATLREEHNATNAAVVVLNPHSGEIRAMVGSLDYFDRDIDGQVNIATSPRQPGSSFKPYTYVTALAQGYTAATTVLDIRTSFPDDPDPPYVPENYDRQYHGPVSLRRALACSYNVPAVAVMNWAGVRNVLDTAHRMGINTLRNEFYGLSLTLGGGEITLLDQTYAYGVFASGGVMHGEPVPAKNQIPGFRELDPVAILRIEDAQGKLIYEYKEPRSKQVISPELAFIVSDILSDNDARSYALGPNSPLKLSRPAAAKTGTTENFHDAWTIGYTPDIVVGVWMGNSDNEAMELLPASQAAGPIYHDVMEYLFKSMPEVEFQEPPGLERMIVDAQSGLLPTQYSPDKRSEIFIPGTAPTTYDNVHRPFRVCKVSGKLATVHCPLEQVEEKVFEIYPPDAADWVRQTKLPQPPADYCPVHGAGPINADVAIITPTIYSSVRGIVSVFGNAKPGDFNFWRLQFGQGMNPPSWTPLSDERHDRADHALLGQWDASKLDGLYTLQLTVVGGSGSFQTSSVQVSVDNISPTIWIMNPWEDKVYIKETDEWVNIQADAQDNVSMGRVEFYLDNKPIGFSTVPPFTLKWNIVMSDTLPYGMQGITQTVTADGKSVMWLFPGGMGIISDGENYTETHVIHAVAFDAAGNLMKSDPVRFYIKHKPKKEDKTSSLPPIDTPYAWLGPDKPRS